MNKENEQTTTKDYKLQVRETVIHSVPKVVRSASYNGAVAARRTPRYSGPIVEKRKKETSENEEVRQEENITAESRSNEKKE